MSNQSSFQVAPNLHLVRQTIPTKTAAKPVQVATNHIVVIDCSGSMYGELPAIRDQLKKKMPKLLGDKDTISIIWFSGRGQFGTLLEAEPVSTLADLQQVNQAIDRWLKPVCLTGFKEPLEEAAKLIERVGKKNKNVFSLFFMSDGCDNQWSRAEILKAVEKSAGGLAAATFVEYGYYADRPLLTAMAEKAGGTLIFSQTFDTYAPAFENVLQKKLAGGKKIEIAVPGDPVGGFVYAMSDGDLITFAVEEGKANVPEGIPEVYYVSPTVVGKADGAFQLDKNNTHPVLNAGYAAISLFSTRMLPDVVLPFLKATGDVAFIEKFGGLFGKQRYSEFMDAAKAAVFDTKQRLTKGYDPSRIPPEDAFTVLELLELLASDDGNKAMLDHPEFKYQRIGRARVDASENLTADEQAEVTKLTEEMGKTKDAKKIAEMAQKIAAITDKKQAALKFVEDKESASEGYAVCNLTYNEEKPNISILVRKSGTVDLSPRLKDGEHPKVPRTFPTFIFRNYAIIKDGLVNVAKLPVKLCDATTAVINEMLAKGKAPKALVGGADSIPAGQVVVLDLSGLPVINRQMVKSCSAKALFEKEWELTKLRAAQKVYNSIKKEKFPRKAEGFEVMYGADAAAWLKDQGLTDYSGFGPKTVQGEARDFYMAKELSIKIKGYSSIPSLNEFKKQATKGKFTASAQLMAPAMAEVDAFLASDIYKKAKNQDSLFETWLDGQFKDAQTQVRKLIAEMARIRFTVVVGQVWFTEFKSLDENSMEITVDKVKLACTVEMNEVKVEI